MAKLGTNASDKQKDAAGTTESVLGNLTISTNPVVIVAVQRKANIGNFETIDLYAAVAVPQPDLDLADKEALEATLKQAIDEGFSLTSRETYERYKQIKDQLKK